MTVHAEQKLLYPVSLLLSTGSKKTAEKLGETCEVSGDTILRALENKSVSPKELIKMVICIFGTDYLNIIIDDTLIEKMHSQIMEGTSDNYDSSKNQTYRSLCSVVAMLSNGRYALPVVNDFWIREEVVGDKYKTKVEIAIELIKFLRTFIRINTVILDGLYATTAMLTWLQENNIRYEMRFHSNRLIQTKNDKKPIKVRDHPALKLANKRTKKTIKCQWNNLSIYVTAMKRTDKKGNISIVYQVSNAKRSAREHVQFYDYRWDIEIFFRTAKQSLGLTDCQSRKMLRQKNHIYNIFLAYIILQFEKRNKRLKNSEAALQKLKCKSPQSLTSYLSSLDQIFRNLETTHA